MQKKRPNAQVESFIASTSPLEGYVSVLTLGELRKGVAQRARNDAEAAGALTIWVNRIEADYQPRILPIDLPVSRLWGELSADRTRPMVDTLLAATALHHQLTLVTRNTRDVADLPIQLINPWMP